MSEVKGRWKGETAGGCFNHASWRLNPQYLLEIDTKTDVKIELSQKRTNPIGFYVIRDRNSYKRTVFSSNDELVVKKSGFKPKQLVSLDLTLKKGKYHIIPCCFEPGTEGSFVLKSSYGELKQIKPWNNQTISGEWDSETAGGCKNNKSFKLNPQYHIKVENTTSLAIVLGHNEDDLDSVGIYLYKSEGKRLSKFLPKDLVANSEFIEGEDESLLFIESLEPGIYTVIPCTYSPDKEGSFKLYFFSNHGIELLKEEEETDTKKEENFNDENDALLEEKRKHLETLKEVQQLKEELLKSKEIIAQLNSKLDALQKSEKDKSEGISQTPADQIEFKETVGELSGNNITLYGEWKRGSAGGCMNYPTWRNNPQYFLTVPSDSTKVAFTLTQIIDDDKPLSQIGFYIINPHSAKGKQVLYLEDGENDISAKSKFISSKSNRVEFTLPATSKYPYVIIPCTFKPGDEKKFSFSIESSEDIIISTLTKKNEWNLVKINDEWNESTAGGCKNHSTFVDNPQYLVTVDENDTTLNILMLQSEKEAFDPISCYVVKIPDTDGKIVKLSKVDNKDIVCKGQFADEQENFVSTPLLNKGKYVIIPCTFNQGKLASFEMNVFSLSSFRMEELASAQVIMVQGEWKGKTAGGCLNDIVTFKNNQQYVLTIKEDIELVFKLQQSTSHNDDLKAIGFYIFKGNGKRKFKIRNDDIKGKGGFTKVKDLVVDISLKAEDSPFIVVPCTLYPNEECSFKLSVSAKQAVNDFENIVSLGPIPLTYKELNASAEWDANHSGGCLNYTSWITNPQFLFTTDKKCEVIVYLSTDLKEDEISKFSGIGFYVTKKDPDSSYRLEMTPKDIYKKAAFRKTNEIMTRFNAEPGSYNIIAATFKPGYYRKFDITVFCDNLEGSSLTHIKDSDITFDGKWDEGNAGGNPSNYEKWIRNPRYYITVKKPMKLAVSLIQSPNTPVDSEGHTNHAIGFTVTHSDGEGNPRTSRPQDLIAKAGFENERDIVATFELEPSFDPYVVIPSTYDPDVHVPFRISLHFDPSYREFVNFTSTLPTPSDEDDSLDADILLAKLQKCINNTALSSIDLGYLIEVAGLTFLTKPAQELQYITKKLQTILNALKAPELFSGDSNPNIDISDLVPPSSTPQPTEVIKPSKEESNETTDNTSPPPPPPPPTSSIPTPPPMKATGIVSEESLSTVGLRKTSQQTKSEYVSPHDELMNIIKNGRTQLKSAALRKLKDKPVEKDLFCAFNMEMLERRRAFEDEEEEDDDDDDWD